MKTRNAILDREKFVINSFKICSISKNEYDAIQK